MPGGRMLVENFVGWDDLEASVEERVLRTTLATGASVSGRATCQEGVDGSFEVARSFLLDPDSTPHEVADIPGEDDYLALTGT